MSINIYEVLNNPNRKKIVHEFIRIQKDLDYEHIKKLVIDDTSRPDFHLKRLVEADLLKRVKKRGFYRLNELCIQPLRAYFQEIVPICLIGGLGQIDLFMDILENFEQISIIPKKYILITSPEINKEFKKFKKGKFSKITTEVQELDFQSILRENYPQVYSELESLIIKNIKTLEMICDLTGGTKTVSLALMDLSTKYNLKKCYFSGRKIIWI